jgi:hypothetical protein
MDSLIELLRAQAEHAEILRRAWDAQATQLGKAKLFATGKSSLAALWAQRTQQLIQLMEELPPVDGPNADRVYFALLNGNPLPPGEKPPEENPLDMEGL